jgi:hypothetical protein
MKLTWSYSRKVLVHHAQLRTAVNGLLGIDSNERVQPEERLMRLHGCRST